MLCSSVVVLALAASRLAFAQSLVEVLESNQETLSALTGKLPSSETPSGQRICSAAKSSP